MKCDAVWTGGAGRIGVLPALRGAVGWRWRRSPASGHAAAAADYASRRSWLRQSAAEEEFWSGTYSPKAMIGPAIGLANLDRVRRWSAALLAAGIGLVDLRASAPSCCGRCLGW